MYRLKEFREINWLDIDIYEYMSLAYHHEMMGSIHDDLMQTCITKKIQLHTSTRFDHVF